MRIMIIGFAFLAVLFSGAPAIAQTSANFGGPNGGSVIPGWDSRVCDGTIGGAIRYNSASSCAEYCDGTDWVCPSSGGGGSGCTAPPSSCINIGDVCIDGSIFAGIIAYGSSCQPFFVADTDQGAEVEWSTLYEDTGADDFTDGQANQAWIVANTTLSNYPAFQLCENLDRHGHQDWYLPSRAELLQLQAYRTAIGGLSTGYYWSSTEFDSIEAWYHHMTADGSSDEFAKDDPTDAPIRCVRRD